VRGFESDWADAIALALERAGTPPEQIAPLATLIVAACRGPLLDLPITGVDEQHPLGARVQLVRSIEQAVDLDLVARLDVLVQPEQVGRVVLALQLLQR
jgi:hypothetical protein